VAEQQVVGRGTAASVVPDVVDSVHAVEWISNFEPLWPDTSVLLPSPPVMWVGLAGSVHWMCGGRSSGESDVRVRL
jgi:predicted oxidoreductase